MSPPRIATGKPALTLSGALAGSEPLAGLLQRVHESRRRFALVAELLPAPLRATVRPGPLDDLGWTLLTDNAASAAKLRQLLPRLQAALAEQGCASPAPAVKIAPRP